MSDELIKLAELANLSETPEGKAEIEDAFRRAQIEMRDAERKEKK